MMMWKGACLCHTAGSQASHSVVQLCSAQQVSLADLTSEQCCCQGLGSGKVGVRRGGRGSSGLEGDWNLSLIDVGSVGREEIWESDGHCAVLGRVWKLLQRFLVAMFVALVFCGCTFWDVLLGWVEEEAEISPSYWLLLLVLIAARGEKCLFKH